MLSTKVKAVPEVQSQPEAAQGFAERLNHLFAAARRADGTSYSVDEVVRWINAHRSPTSRDRVATLRRADTSQSAPEPDPAEAAALAEFFCVSPTYFTTPEPAAVDGPLQDRLIQQRLADYRAGTIPQRLYYLFTTIVRADKRPYTTAEVARWINSNGGKITTVYIQKLLTGERGKNPSEDYLRWISRFFEIDVRFFLEERPVAIDGLRQSAVILLRNRHIAELVQLYAQLTPGQQDAVHGLITKIVSDNAAENTP
ncbi:hypothetical protein [Pseudonocardia sp. ICBG601]|uniref:hypothetical protein n=1 Tax=Pseudonocardia sp. ICBG601 TaxID=2846759 RepID=UPI001CF6D806|nr:hypothetical protein [Pseudonocardia sp. ICBG601]